MLTSGQQFDRFTILEKLGEGGMGAVYLARDGKLDRRVALKILPAEFIEDPERRERFQREARTAAGITHANVVAIHDLGEADGPDGGAPLAFIVMEYVEGQPLGAYLESHALELPQLMRLAEKIASGLAAAHRLNIVHRDIKPDNIIVDPQGEPRILDFGLAKPLRGPLHSNQPVGDDAATMEADLTQEGRVVGTVTYMSPEQAQGEPLDTRSDIFSFGVLLYRLTTGHTPFTGSTQVAILARILESEHDRPRAHNAGIPESLEAIIDRCLAKHPDDRYQDTQELVSDLRTLRREFDSGISHSELSVERSAVARRRAPSTRRWWVRGAVAVLAALAVLAGVNALRGRDTGSPPATAGEPSLAILRFENKTGDEELAWLATGLPEILLTDLAQIEELNLVSLERVQDELKRSGTDPRSASHGELVAAGRRLGATRVLSGSYYRLGDQIRIDTRIEDAHTGSMLHADKVVGVDAFGLVESLTGTVANRLHMAQTAETSSDRPTGSAAAYRAYHLGNEKLMLGFGDEARVLFREAMDVDSTFVLPYVRLGMTHVFEGREQEGAPWFEKALERKDALSPRERQRLDIYADVWLRRDFSGVQTKMEAFVNAYPDDKEALALYGAVVVGFVADTTTGFAQFEKVLAIDPEYPFALQLYAQDLRNFQEYDRAIALMERYVGAHPESPTGYEQLGVLYNAKENYGAALAAYERFRAKFPGDPAVLNDMAELAIREGDYARARGYTDLIEEVKPGDAQWALRAESMRCGISMWEGRFDETLSHARKALSHAFALGDTAMIFAGHRRLATYSQYIEEPDSCLAWLERGRSYASPMQGSGYPTTAVEIDPSLADEARPELEATVSAMRRTLPANMHYIPDAVATIFEAYAATDTLAMIAALRSFMEFPPNQRNPANGAELARYLISQGEFEEALPYLEDYNPSSAYWSMHKAYWSGMAYEGLGDGERASKAYRTVLDTWGDADRDLEFIRGARAGLARLSG